MLDFDILNPFSTFDGDKVNGATFMIMESERILNETLPLFKQAILEGKNPNNVKDIIFKYCKASEANLLPNDKKKLEKEVEDFYKKVHF